jgi:hypothetical protein
MVSSVGSDAHASVPNIFHVQGADHVRKHVLPALAKQLGESMSDLKDQLKSGKSLSQIASDAGLSQDQLLATIKSGLQASASSGTAIPDATLDALAQRIANRTQSTSETPPTDSGDDGSDSSGPNGILA